MAIGIKLPATRRQVIVQYLDYRGHMHSTVARYLPRNELWVTRDLVAIDTSQWARLEWAELLFNKELES